jgi:excisionase family DNA binding protein
MSFDASIRPTEVKAGAPLLHSFASAQKRLMIGRTKLFELVASGDIETVRIGSRRLIPAQALDEFVARLRAKSVDKVDKVDKKAAALASEDRS